MPAYEPGTTAQEIRSWAAECCEMTKDRLLESQIWQAIAEAGQEYQIRLNKDGSPCRGGAMMTPRECFTNSQLTVIGGTRFDPTGCVYAEGYALSTMGIWQHHGWLVDADGLVIDRTWREPGRRYIGVPVLAADGTQLRPPAVGSTPGDCLLVWEPCGMAWAPGMSQENADRLFGSVTPRKIPARMEK